MKNNNVDGHLSLLGYRVRDMVTGLEGVVTTVCFDLYGCIQAVVHPGVKEDGTFKDLNWFDVSRLEVISVAPVMAQPNFDFGPIAEGLKGPAEKPAAKA